MRSVPLLLLALMPFFGYAQTEFEGEIRYVHFFKYKQYVSDTSIAVKQFGNSSYFYYKKGNYVWAFNGSELEKEYSMNNVKKVYAKFKEKDSIFSYKPENNDTIISYKIKKNADTILGIPVNELTIVTAKKGSLKNLFTRRIYYSTKYPILPQHASHLTNFANHEVYKITKAFPLRLEFDNDSWPFIVRYQAVRIIPRPIKPQELQLPNGAKIKN